MLSSLVWKMVAERCMIYSSLFEAGVVPPNSSYSFVRGILCKFIVVGITFLGPARNGTCSIIINNLNTYCASLLEHYFE